MSLVHLMEHTSGFDDIHLREYALNDPTPIPLKDALAFGASSRVCRWPPGSRYSYCNSGPAVLAAVIEKISREHFEDYVQEHFFNPLHMDTASYFYTPAVQQHLTKLYHSDGVTPYPYWHIAYRAAGSINASPKDMANYVRFYLQRGSFDGKQLLQPTSIERLETPETLPSAKLGRMAGYGLYNCETLEGAFVFHGHGGAVEGGLTDMAYLPDFGRGYAMMINSGNFRALTRISELVRHYIVRGLTPPALPPVACVPADVQRHYNGYYQFISPRRQLTYGLRRLLEIQWLGFTSNSVSLIGLSRAQMVPVTDRLFRKSDESIATLALLPDSDGETLIQYDRMNFSQSPGSMTFKKVSGWRVWGEIFGIVVVSISMLSSPIRVLVLVARKISSKLHNAGPLSLRLMPLLSTIFFGTFWGLIFFNRGDSWALGSYSGASAGIMLSSIAFALTATASLCLVYRHRHTPMSCFAYWHSVLVAIGVSTAAVYMGYWGWIGLRLWAY